MWRSIGAVMAGYAVMACVVIVGTIVAGLALLGPKMMSAAPEATRPTPPYLAVNLAIGLAAAVLGGLTAARIGRRAPLSHAAALAAIVLLLTLITMSFGGSDSAPGGGQPPWYPYATAAIGVVGTTASGAWIAARRHGRAPATEGPRG